ncbi:polysaccharide deacetylase [Nitratireductor indicus C115]|uniref:Chitooligosaccharide deacetylase n=1 Tax=Nitratireductor indicus C115 TaxID=1231190 RepID=K2N0E9_9HYPH|nr:polysaccharide deacetylase family protein [Nitratireductor indicus]EKF40993.1 polysaccharide deacetylase [Nitratireductor indicus C115]SFQ73655.1 Peptidoglycan/xylan/chitin deacetylase, PgdA/CDA1 family [Nitratireductor indicus]
MLPLQAFKRFARYGLIRAGLEGSALLQRAGFGMKPQARGVIFTLHHVDPKPVDPEAPNSWLSITPQFLEEAIQATLESGLTPIALEDLTARLADRSDTRRYACFTLDDGYRDNAEHAAPVFGRYGVPYTIFITAGFVERRCSIWWKTAAEIVDNADAFSFDFGHGEQKLNTTTHLRKIAAFDRLAAFVTEARDEEAAIARIDALAKTCGVDPLAITAKQVMNADELGVLARDPLAHFGAHTLSHRNLRKLGDGALRDELVQSAEAVERYVGRYPRTLAYPYGYRAAVGEREIAMAAAAGFDLAVTTMPGLIGSDALSKPTALARVSLNGLYQRKRYVNALLSELPFRLQKIAGGS